MNGKEEKSSGKETRTQPTDVKKVASPLVMFSFVISTEDCSRFGFFIPKKSHLILPLGKGKNMSQWGLVLHTHDAYIPFSIHNPRIIFSAIIINLFQILPIIGNGTRKRGFYYIGKTLPS